VRDAGVKEAAHDWISGRLTREAVEIVRPCARIPERDLLTN
jgi:hypothetical protein